MRNSEISAALVEEFIELTEELLRCFDDSRRVEWLTLEIYEGGILPARYHEIQQRLKEIKRHLCELAVA